MDEPHVIVMFGATGDLARRKLLPGLLHLFQTGLLPPGRIVGTSPSHARRSASSATGP
jgi:glucose-6-phosphate 1-dehydrogenase